MAWLWVAAMVSMTGLGPDPRLGVYRSAGGDRLIVFQLDTLRLGIGFGAGEIRGLAGPGPVFGYGPSIGAAEPEEGRIEFESAADRVERVRWTRAGHPLLVLERLAIGERAVAFAHGAIELKGTVVTPANGTADHAVVFVHGSGVETREASRAMAYVLADRGIASLIFDKRASGQSGGASVDVPFADLAGDVLAAVDCLRRQPGIRPSGVGLLGTSQGTWVSLEAAARDTAVAFVVLVSGGGTTPLDAEMNRGEQTLRRATRLSDEEITAAVRFRRQKFDYAITGGGKEAYEAALDTARKTGWFRHVGDRLPNQAFWRPNGYFDPIPHIRTFRRPMLAVFGAMDANNDPARNLSAIRAAWGESGHPANRAVLFEHASHGLFETTVAAPVEQQILQVSRMVPGYLDLVPGWILGLR